VNDVNSRLAADVEEATAEAAKIEAAELLAAIGAIRRVARGMVRRTDRQAIRTAIPALSRLAERMEGL
jgi:hypothetical protein